MTDREMRRLSRAELLELLLTQTQETERLQEKLKEAEAMLSERHLKIQEAGDLAHAVLAINDVMGAAQRSAQQYLDNIAAMEEAARAECEKMRSDAGAECERMLAAASAECERMLADAGVKAELICQSAQNSVGIVVKDGSVDRLIREIHEILDEKLNK